jgi:hypothetical protein
MPRFDNLSAEELEQIKRSSKRPTSTQSMTRCALSPRRQGVKSLRTRSQLWELRQAMLRWRSL